ncbi:hypothetical protein KSP39_PZI021671 [Platanthera zijinensis]|uniref:Putative plant transposon protein domain-containing protein n=1 Tax=Platanthera zijinensis TaxID=2320716 RepID=A0AAP0AXX4_9ASPA
MSGRKGKGKVVVYKDDRFVNDEARVRYDLVKLKQVIFERGFEMEMKYWSKGYIDNMQKQGWSTFCHPRTEAILPWVYEFYANGIFQNDDKVLVRGKEVNFSPQGICECFDMGNPEWDEYEQIKNTVSPDEVAAILCQAKTNMWANPRKHVLNSTSFTREAKVWMLFVNASLLPTKHANQISLERAVLIYCIMLGRKINAGQMIYDQLKERFAANGGRQLWYPTLITLMCRFAGVSLREGDICTLVGHHITETIIFKNIKVRTDHGSLPPTSKGKSTTTTHRVDIDIPAVDCGSDPDVMMENLEYIKAYIRCEHIYSESRREQARQERTLIMHKLKIPVVEPSYNLGGQFDDEGYLLGIDGSRVDPTIVAAEKEADREDDDDDDE